MSVINFELVKNPLNWLTVILMVTIAAIALHLICSHYSDATA